MLSIYSIYIITIYLSIYLPTYLSSYVYSHLPTNHLDYLSNYFLTLAINVTRLDAVPPGAQPTSINPIDN